MIASYKNVSRILIRGQLLFDRSIGKYTCIEVYICIKINLYRFNNGRKKCSFTVYQFIERHTAPYKINLITKIINRCKSTNQLSVPFSSINITDLIQMHTTNTVSAYY